MSKSNIHGRGNLRKVNPDWFTGKTWMKVVSDTIGSDGHDIYHVHFEGGSVTKLHAHNGAQLLMATAGRGMLETFTKMGASKSRFGIARTGRTILREGDVAHVPAGVLHVHGSADANQTFSHVAINALPRKNAAYKTDWYESDFKSQVYGTIR